MYKYGVQKRLDIFGNDRNAITSKTVTVLMAEEVILHLFYSE
jgi:hypothetical protein